MGASNHAFVRLAVVMACHNRREKTLRCLESLRSQVEPGQAIDVFLLDDGSRDGTADAVRKQFPEVRILTGDGVRYWAGGMRVAFAAAMNERPDYYLWLNDDLVLCDGAVARLLATCTEVERSGSPLNIVVGAVTNRGMQTAIYGGINRRPGWNRVRFQTHTALATEPVQCDTMSGNAVLIPAAVVQRVGNIDAAFRHILGDLDYGLRAGSLGCKVWVAPGIIGYLTAQDAGKRIYNPNIGWLARWRIQRSPFGLQFNPWWTFCFRHGGATAFLSFVWPYWRFLFPSSIQRFIGRWRGRFNETRSRQGSGTT